MLETFKKKVEEIAELYVDKIEDKIILNEKFAEINEGIRMLNHIACTLERIERMQRETMDIKEKDTAMFYTYKDEESGNVMLSPLAGDSITIKSIKDVEILTNHLKDQLQ